MITSPQNIAPFDGSKAQHNIWLAEAIWGHRIEHQTTSGLLLEFLSMAEGMHRQAKLLNHELGYASYTPYLSTQLRNILFNNPNIEEIAQEAQNDDEAWERWLTAIKEVAVVEKESLRDFRYLKERFDTFESLVDVVKLLRNIALDPTASRSWTYMLLFPVGPAAFYDERSLKRGKEGFEKTRVIFTRTGELAYLMLSRARPELRTRIATHLRRIFDPSSPKNLLLLRLMAGEQPDFGDEKNGTYLPYIQHPAFDRMAEDVTALFQLNLPGTDTLAHLGPLLAFHLLLYQFETANAVLGKAGLPPLTCEILAPRPNLVRRASIASYNDNEALGVEAVERYLELLLDSDSELNNAIKNANLDDADKREIFKERVKDLLSLKPELNGNSVDELRNDLLRIARKAYADAAGDAVTSLARQCGLASKIKTTQYRYAPTDLFLRNLVYVTVSAPMKESDFLSLLYDRYRLVIGPEEAKLVREENYGPEFVKNNERLLRRLMAMGLARRMSDSFTYVINPIAENHA